MSSQASPRDLLAALRAEEPKFHRTYTTGEPAGSQNFQINYEVLEWLIDNLPSDARALETGCGYSTVVLAATCSSVATFSPDPEEHKLIAQWCGDHGLPTDHVDFQAGFSQDLLPGFDAGPLDLVIVDGDHAFPAPVIDWYYTADSVKAGGCVIVDDTQIPSGGILRDFLHEETDRWSIAATMTKTSIFRRETEEPVARGVHWVHQPYCCVKDGGVATIPGRAIRKLGRILNRES
ncbi:MAG: class I SAM-dependent methyltransferase [Planctomycetota bacterium]